MTFREHPPIRIASGDGGCYIMHLRCMTFREHPPIRIAFGDGGCYIMHLRDTIATFSRRCLFFFQIYLLYVIKQFPFASK